METKVMPIDEESIALAAKLLLDGEVVAIPTETVYGLAANALNSTAVSRIFEAKGRPQDNPLISHISDVSMLPMVTRQITNEAKILARVFWPGPLTMVLPRAKHLADNVCAGLDTAGVRMPSNNAAKRIINAAGVPLAAPSANLSGSPSPTTAAHVFADMNKRIPLILDGGACSVGVESTVITFEPQLTILRPGVITEEDIKSALNKSVEIAKAVFAPLSEGETTQSPGMKYAHYAPKAQITIVDGQLENYINYIKNNNKNGVFALCFEEELEKMPVPAVSYGKQEDEHTQAAGIFAALRKLDENGALFVYARCPKQKGVGLAVYNRLLRAAAFRVVKV